MKSIENMVLSRIYGRGKGFVFSSADFIDEFRVQIKICTKADTDPLIWLDSSFTAPSGALRAQ